LAGAFQEAICPIPEVLIPIDELVFVQVNVQPNGTVENVAGIIAFVGQTAMEFIGAKSGIGRIVIVVLIGNPWQELAVGIIV
jgi:hypothetical protein